MNLLFFFTSSPPPAPEPAEKKKERRGENKGEREMIVIQGHGSKEEYPQEQIQNILCNRIATPKWKHVCQVYTFKDHEHQTGFFPASGGKTNSFWWREDADGRIVSGFCAQAPQKQVNHRFVLIQEESPVAFALLPGRCYIRSVTSSTVEQSDEWRRGKKIMQKGNATALAPPTFWCPSPMFR